MKKFFAVVLVAVMVVSALALTACGGGGGSSQDLSDSKYVGTWKATGVAVENVGEEDFGEDEVFYLNLNGDGTGTLEAEGEDPSNFTWELTSDGFKTKGDVKLTFTDDGDNIKAKLFGIELLFEKQ